MNNIVKEVEELIEPLKDKINSLELRKFLDIISKLTEGKESFTELNISFNEIDSKLDMMKVQLGEVDF